MSIDYADYLTEKRLKALENKLKRDYQDAYEGMCETWDQYINGYDETVITEKGAKNVHHKSLQERYDEELGKFQSGQSGYKDQAEFDAWYQTQVMRGEKYNNTIDELAEAMTTTNVRASAYINDDVYSIYALNANYQAFKISEEYESVSFRLYSEETVKALVTGENHVEFDRGLKTTSVNPQKDYNWNRDQITSALISGILQGKSIDRIADSFYTVMGRNRASAIRNARTAYTSAQNGGRQNTAERAQKMGIKSQKQWLAIGDERTRFSHAMLNGQIRDIEKPFSNGLMYPADPSGSPAEVYNCRCKRLYVLPKYENKISNETYDQWQKMSPEEQKAERDSYNKWVKDQQAKKSLGDGTYKKSGYDFSNFGKVAPQATNSNGISGIIRNYSGNISQTVGKQFYDGIHDALDKSGSKVAEVWGKFEDQIGVAETNVKREYCDFRAKIHLNTARDSKGSRYEVPYGVTFHEGGHAIDMLAGRSNGGLYYSSVYKQGIFAKTIKSEVDAIVKRYDQDLKAEFKANGSDPDWLLQNGYISQWGYDWYKKNGSWFGNAPKHSKGVAYKKLENEIKKLDPRAIADLSDMLEGATKGKIQCGYGHGSSYWKQPENLGTEAFAEMTSASIANPDSLATIKKYLPDSYKVYEEMIQNLL